MKFFNIVKKALLSVILVIPMFFFSVVPAHAVGADTVISVALGVVQLVVDYAKSTSASEKQSYLNNVYVYWKSVAPSSDSSVVNVGGDELYRLCSELNSQGFPCEVVEKASGGSSYYVIQGLGYVFIPGVLEARVIALQGRYFANSSGFYYMSTEDSSVKTLDLMKIAFAQMAGRLSEIDTNLRDFMTTRMNDVISATQQVSRAILAVGGTDASGTYESWGSKIYNLLSGSSTVVNVNTSLNIDKVISALGAKLDRIYNILHDSINSLLARITNASESTNTMVRASYFLLNDNLTTSLTTINQSIQALGNNWTVDNSDVISRIDVLQSAIIAKLDSLSTGVTTNIENVTTNITNDNSAYNVFYVTDADENSKTVTSVAGDSVSVIGKLLDFLYKAVFQGAITDSDSGIGDLSDFYLSPGEGSENLWGS